MRIEDVKQVGIVGCGTMGPTIATAVCLKYAVVVREVSPALAEEALTKIARNLPGLVKRGKITEEEKNAALARVRVVTDLEEMKDCQMIIDATPDVMEIKGGALSALNEICSPETVMSTTSSLMSITALAAASKRPDRFIGLHFCIPAHLMDLVEVARAIQTSDETYKFAVDFCASLGKVTVTTKDAPGFIVNFMLFPVLVAAINAHANGLATPKEIDTAMKLGLGHAMGPFELLDMTGLDSAVRGFESLYEQTQDEAFAVPPLLRKMVEAGYLGRKTGRGFYDYSAK